MALVTRNRAASLLRTLQSFERQEVRPWEVVVSDDSDEDRCGEVKAMVEARGFRYLRGPRRGLYANRNHAALACTGTHVRTMDDDHEFPAGHFRSCLEAVHSDPAAVWIISECYPGCSWALVCPGQLHPRGFAMPPADPDNCWSVSDGATIYPACIFQQGIRFAEYYNFGASYLEFGSRLHWLGYRIRHVPGTAVIHHYDVRARSYQDEDMARSSRYFAALCHSYIYQPTLRNKILCCLQIISEAVCGKGGRSLRPAFSAYRDHKKKLFAQCPAQATASENRLSKPIVAQLPKESAADEPLALRASARSRRRI